MIQLHFGSICFVLAILSLGIYKIPGNLDGVVEKRSRDCNFGYRSSCKYAFSHELTYIKFGNQIRFFGFE
jgi:hypothetical protein